MSAPVFVFTGHGDETLIPHGERSKLPAGYTLVTFTVCGTTSRLPEIYDTLGHMNAAKPFDNPVQNKKTIEELLGRKIRVYTAGTPYPDLKYFSTGNHHPPDREGKSYTLYFKSGVYKLPVQLDVHPEWKVTDTVVRHKPTRYTFEKDLTVMKYAHLVKVPEEGNADEAAKARDIAKRSYTRAVFPDEATIDAIVNGTRDDEFSLPEVFAAIGPGVYYWPICRGDAGDAPPMLADIRSASDAYQAQGGRKPRTKSTRSRLQTRRRKHRNGPASVRRYQTRRVLS